MPGTDLKSQDTEWYKTLNLPAWRNEAFSYTLTKPITSQSHRVPKSKAEQ